jgi:hypothetical protein
MKENASASQLVLHNSLFVIILCFVAKVRAGFQFSGIYPQRSSLAPLS